MALAPNTRLGPYEILSRIGAGGMGEVYKARDARLNRTVAIKVLLPDAPVSEHSRRRFLQEARSASSLNHPHIVMVHDIGREGDVDYIVMEFVAGRTLDFLIGAQGMKLSELLSYSIQIADALGSAHAAGIIHRDLKPGNVMVMDDGRVKVLDFGLAKVTESPQEKDATMSAHPRTEEGAIVGTASYMSPEQAQGLPVDSRTDIFSFGAVVYEMATGKRAFRGDSKISTLAAILEKEPPPIEGMPPRLEQIIRHCLRKDPAKRSRNLLDVKLALEDLKQDSESLIRPAVRRPRRVWVWLAPTALALVAASAAVWMWTRSPKDAGPPLQPVPLTFDPGREVQPSFSPDGNQVAFAAIGERNFDINLMVVGAASRLRLTSDPEPELGPAWSPDGRFLYFLRFRGNSGAMIEIPALGGAERTLTDYRWARRTTVPYPYPKLSCSPDGRWVAVSGSANQSGGPPDAIFVVGVRSGDIRQITVPPAGSLGDFDPVFAPDGRRLAFTRALNSSAGRPYVVDLDEDLKPRGDPRPFGRVSGWVAHPVWLTGGAGILASRKMGAVWAFVRLPSEGSEGESVPLPAGGTLPAISHTRSRLAYTVELEDRNLWRIEIGAPGKQREAQMVAPSTKLDHVGQYSPDGSRIAFCSDRSGTGQIWVAKADGSAAVQLTSLGPYASACSPGWSPDGRQIAFDANADGQQEIYVIGSGGGAPRRLTSYSGRDVVPRWSRDGKSIYFSSDRSGRDQVWRMSAEGGQPVQVTQGGGIFAEESADGKTLYYSKGENETEIWSLPLSGGAENPVGKSNARRMFVAVEDGIYYVNSDRVLMHVRISSGVVREVAKLPGSSGPGLSMTPDAKWFLYTRLDQRTSDLMMVENFR